MPSGLTKARRSRGIFDVSTPRWRERSRLILAMMRRRREIWRRYDDLNKRNASARGRRFHRRPLRVGINGSCLAMTRRIAGDIKE